MVNTNMFEFKHPKYYTELRKRNREVLRSGRGLAVNQAPHVSDQVISDEASTEATSVHPGPGQKHQASSFKQQAPSKPEPVQVQASSAKRQASQPE